MSDTFNIKLTEYTKRRLYKEIRDRVIDCFEPRCWLIKDPNDIGQIYLDRNIVAGGEGRYVQIRRLTFLMFYGWVPDRRRITMRCQNRCVNPAHARVIRFNPSPDDVHTFIDDKWLSVEDARKWYFSGEK